MESEVFLELVREDRFAEKYADRDDTARVGQRCAPSIIMISAKCVRESRKQDEHDTVPRPRTDLQIGYLVGHQPHNNNVDECIE